AVSRRVRRPDAEAAPDGKAGDKGHGGREPTAQHGGTIAPGREGCLESRREPPAATTATVRRRPVREGPRPGAQRHADPRPTGPPTAPDSPDPARGRTRSDNADTGRLRRGSARRRTDSRSSPPIGRAAGSPAGECRSRGDSPPPARA